MMHSIERGLSEEQRMMRDTCRAFVDDFVTPFIRRHWQREWTMQPEERLPASLLEQAHKIGIRTLAVPEEFGGTPIGPKEEVRTFAVIAEELARGDSGLDDKLVQIWKVSVLLRAAAVFLQMDGTTDISRFKIVKALFPDPAGVYAGAEK